MQQKNKKKVILDTDIGEDPDDIFALLLALAYPEIDVQLIVTSNENNGNKARFVTSIIRAFKKDILVVKGGNDKLEHCLINSLVYTSSLLNENALEEIANVVENNDIVYYVCIGPQTNLASFLKAYPSLSSKMDIVIMGGALQYRKKDSAEFNIRQDVDSAKYVFELPLKRKYIISDTTFIPELKVSSKHSLYGLINKS